MEENKKKITTFGLVMMIITAIFGFGNVSNAYAQMGYGSIIWYILAGVCFFFPCGLMMAEYGSAFKDAKGGIYSWLAESIGERAAFIGTFIWLASWIVWMVSTASRIWITFSALIFGKDTTQHWSMLGLSSTEVIGILGILFILISTFFTTQGMDSISKVGSLGGIFTVVTNIIFLIASLIIIFANHGQLAQPIHGMKDFITSPNPQFQTPIAIISFVVYAIFAYGGMESLGSVTDSMDKPEKTFPRGLIIASLIIIFANHGQLAQPIHGMKDFITSPNPQFQTPIAIISFVVYAIFAYGGMESLGSVTDSMDKPEKTFPRGLIIASLFTIGAYVIMIFMIGFSVNYNSVVAKHGVNLGNITYIVFNQLGVYLGHSLGWSAAASHTTGMLITRFVALTQVLGFLGAMFILLYSPIKSFILGSDKRLWPEKLTRLNKIGRASCRERV